MKKYTNQELCLLWLDSFIGLEYIHKQQLYKLINGKPDIRKLIERGKDYIVSNLSEKVYDTVHASATAEYMDFLMGGLERRNIAAVTVVSEDYPDKLKSISAPPLVLYCKGDASLLKSRAFGIVGSRKSLPLSLSLASEYTKALSKAGFTIVTGIAEGVDTAVLSAATDCGARPVSVIAGGFDNVYPKSNASLFEKVVKNGLAVTESPPETTPLPFLFPVRNRIIAGLAEGVLIASGGLKSGTLYTAEYAEEFGRDVFAVPYSPGVASGAGCNELLKRNPHIMLTDSPKDILDFYGITPEKTERSALNETETKILSLLSEGGKHIDGICSALGMRVQEIAPFLAMLEIKGYVFKNGVNVYCAKILEE